MKQPALFDLPAQDKSRSKAARLAAFIAAHGILTHYAGSCRPDRHMALLPVDEDKGKDIAEIMAERCRIYDENNRVTTAPSRLAAVRELARLQNIPCDL